MPKFLLLFVALFFVGPIKAQQRKDFQFWISSIDVSAFSRITYHVTADSIIIKDGAYDFLYFAKDYKKDEIVFGLKLDSAQKNTFSKIGLIIYKDSLKSQYTNLCIIDGTILYFHFEFGGKEKSTTLSNYYLATMKPFVDFVNQTIPKKYNIYYDKGDLKKLMQECPPDKILD